MSYCVAAIFHSALWQKMMKVLGRTWKLIILENVPGTQFHHQNILAKEWSWNWGLRPYYSLDFLCTKTMAII